MKMLKLNPGTRLTLVFTALVIFFLLDSFELSKLAGWIPQATLATTLGLLILQLLAETSFGPRHPQPTPASGADGAADIQRSGRKRAMAMAFLWISSLAPTVWLFGMSTGAALFCLVYLRWHADEPWKFSIIFSSILGLTLQMGFTGILHITLYPGVISGVLP